MSHSKDHFCDVCMMKLNSAEQYMAHIMGTAHSKKLQGKMQAENSESQTQPECQDQDTEQTGKDDDSSTSKPPLEEKQRPSSQMNIQHNQGNWCVVCSIPLTSSAMAKAHFDGRKHINKLSLLKLVSGSQGEDSEQKKKDPATKEDGDGCTSKPQVETKFKAGARCEVCNVGLTSDIQAKAHFEGRKHINKMKLASESQGEGSQATAVDVKPTAVKEVITVNSLEEFNQILPALESTPAPEAIPDAPDGTNKNSKPQSDSQDVWIQSKCVMCGVCKAKINTKKSASDHFNGFKHNKKVSAAQISGSQGEDAEPGTQGTTVKDVITVNSLEEFNQILPALESTPEPFPHSNNKNSKAQSDAQDFWIQSKCVMCGVCKAKINTKKSACDHFNSVKHNKKVSAAQRSGSQGEDAEPGTQGTAVKEIVTVNSLDELQQIIETSDSTCTAEATPDGNSSTPPPESVWIKSKEVFCRVCLSFIASKEAAIKHFHGQGHSKKAFSAQRAQQNPNKWCQLCLVRLDSEDVVNKHYDGKQHRSQVKLAAKLGLQEEPLADFPSDSSPHFESGPKLGDKRTHKEGFEGDLSTPGSFRSPSPEGFGLLSPPGFGLLSPPSFGSPGGLGSPSPRKIPKKSNTNDSDSDKAAKGGLTGQHYCSFCNVHCNTHQMLMKHRKSEKHLYTLSIQAGNNEIQAAQNRNLRKRQKHDDILSVTPATPVEKFEELDVAKKFSSSDA